MEGENVWVNVNVNVNVSECCLSALARELGGARLLFTNTANAELSGDELIKLGGILNLQGLHEGFQSLSCPRMSHLAGIRRIRTTWKASCIM
jgi:hypothetical protein